MHQHYRIYAMLLHLRHAPPTSTYAYRLLPTNHAPMPPCHASTPCDPCPHAPSIYAMQPTPCNLGHARHAPMPASTPCNQHPAIYAMHPMPPCPHLRHAPMPPCPHAPMQPGRHPVGQQLQASTSCTLSSIYAMHPHLASTPCTQTYTTKKTINQGRSHWSRSNQTHTHQHWRKYRYLSHHTHLTHPYTHTFITHQHSLGQRLPVAYSPSPSRLPPNHTHTQEKRLMPMDDMSLAPPIPPHKPGRSRWPL
ncbi:hypothetical protein A4X09_0g7784 [Tilletia walkeri]|uniref:Uncharacterized protein n=1 Tax=Tilletia walkeri TaxID=117179 RepID=A0A8X7T1B1_9BASI|nr:hypothetical protein A4X09_0g7784 [Tilletia walkeri]